MICLKRKNQELMGAEIMAQFLENDKQNQTLDDMAALASGIAEGTVVKWSSSLSKWVVCDGTVGLETTDIIGVVTYANGTSGQVKTSGVYVDSDLSTLGNYYCQSDGSIGQTETAVFIGVVTSAGRLCLPGGGGGSITPATMDKLGGIMVGAGLRADANGVLTPGNYPSWFFDRGDGSDGAFNPVANCTISGIKNYTNVNIPVGVTVTVALYAKIKCQGAAIIAGTLTATGQGTISTGYRGGNSGAGGANSQHSAGAPGITAAYVSGWSIIACTTELLALATQEDEIHFGSKGGNGADGDGDLTVSGGYGGGSITLVASEISVTGSMVAHGAKGSNSPSNWAGSGGGGGGGAVKLIANTITNTGTVGANGGQPGDKLAYGYAGVAGSAGITFLKELGA